MAKFIKLTSTEKDRDPRPVLINVDHIVYVIPMAKMNKTLAHNTKVILTPTEGTVHIEKVAETFEEIEMMINSKAN